MNINEGIRTEPKEHCIACGSTGTVLYENLRDKLFGAPGQWTMKQCNNPGCGMLWLDPAPIEADLHKLYQAYYTHEAEPEKKGLLKRLYDDITQAYINKKYGYKGKTSILGRLLSPLLVLHPGRHADADAKVFHLPYKPGGKLLEIGCGEGTTLEYLSKQGWDCTGIDFDRKAVATARKRNLTIFQGGIDEQHFDKESFDAIVMSHVIEHIPDPTALLNKCHDLLRAGGRLTCYTPNASSLGHKVYKSNWRGLEAPRHVNIFTRKALLAITEETNWHKTTAVSHSRGRRIFSASRRLARDQEPNAKTGINEKVAGDIFEIAEGISLLIHSCHGEELALHCVKKL